MSVLTRALAVALILVATCAVAIAAGAWRPPNGNFESGTLKGWKHPKAGPGHWEVYDADDVTPRLLIDPFYEPPEGTFAAMTDQDGPSRQFLHRTIAVPEDKTTRLRLLAFYDSNAAFRPQRDFKFSDPEDHPNQQFRIDLMRGSAPLRSLDHDDVLENMFLTRRGDPRKHRPKAITANLTEWAGRTIRLRIAVVVTRAELSAGVDAVRVKSKDAG